MTNPEVNQPADRPTCEEDLRSKAISSCNFKSRLEAAAKEDRIKKTKGLGAASQAKLLIEIMPAFTLPVRSRLRSEQVQV